MFLNNYAKLVLLFLKSKYFQRNKCPIIKKYIMQCF